MFFNAKKRGGGAEASGHIFGGDWRREFDTARGEGIKMFFFNSQNTVFSSFSFSLHPSPSPSPLSSTRASDEFDIFFADTLRNVSFTAVTLQEIEKLNINPVADVNPPPLAETSLSLMLIGGEGRVG